MPLPTSRNHTYTPGDPPRSYDLNDFQDSIVNLHAANVGGAHGDRVLWVSPVNGGGVAGKHQIGGGAAIAIGGDPWGDVFWWGLPLHTGDRIKEVRFYYRNWLAAGFSHFAVLSVSLTTFDPDLGDPILTSLGAADTAVSTAFGSVVVTPNHTILDTESIVLQWWNGNTNDRAYACRVLYDHPLGP